MDETQDADPPEPGEGGTVVAGRYRLGGVLGRGGFGAVHAAHDLRADIQVAIKLLRVRTRSQIAYVRREVTALRGARLPHVVPLLDDGSQGFTYYIVMPVVEGRAFPGEDGPSPWKRIRGSFEQLLGCIARVHYAGLLHRDLKPANVLVDPEGGVTVVDFGIARVAQDDGERFEGTASYSAPEQLDCVTSTASDQYSLGLMLFEALTGRLPHVAEPTAFLRIRARRLRPAPAVLSLKPDVPVKVANAVDRMLAIDPAARFGDLAEVMVALDMPPPFPTGLDRADATKAGDLRDLFAGPEAFLHLPEDGARALFARTGGQCSRVRRTLEAWARAGRGYWQDERFVLNRVTVESLLNGERTSLTLNDPPLPDDQRDALYWLRLGFPHARVEVLATLAGGDFGASVAALIERGLAWTLAGGTQVGVAIARNDTPQWSPAQRSAALDGLAEVHADDPAAHYLVARPMADVPLDRLVPLVDRMVREGRGRALLSAAVKIALSRSAPDAVAQLEPLVAIAALATYASGAVHEGLFWLGRMRAMEGPLDRLLHAALASQEGAVERGLELMATLPEFADFELDLARVTVRVSLARKQPEAKAAVLLESLTAWAHFDPRRLARWHGWRGNHCYRTGDFARSHRLHAQAAVQLSGVELANARLNSAAALLEVGELDEAVEMASASVEAAAAARHPGFEAVATGVLQTVRYRAGAPVSVDWAQLEAAERVEPAYVLNLAVAGAASRFRAGQLLEAAAISDHAARIATKVGHRPLAALHMAIRGASGGGLTAEERDWCEGIAENCEESVALQIIGLLRRVADSSDLRERANTLAARYLGPHETRLDVLSVEEAACELGATTVSPPSELVEGTFPPTF